MRIVFLGSTKFGLRCLQQITRTTDCEVVGVLTVPQRFPISYRPTGVHNVLYADVLAFATNKGFPCSLMEGKMSDASVVDLIRAWHPDLIVVVGWYHKIPRQILEIAPAAGLHASLLPAYSGGAPLVWAMINGEPHTGISFFLLDEGIDTGPIIGQARTDIYDDDTIATLYDRIEDLGVQLLAEQLPKIAQGRAVYLPQDSSRRRVYPQRSPEDGQINWSSSAQVIRNFVRAQTKPYPGAFTYWKGEKLTIWACRVTDPPTSNGGGHNTVGELHITHRSNYVVAVCGESTALELAEVSYAGQDMSGADFKKTFEQRGA